MTKQEKKNPLVVNSLAKGLRFLEVFSGHSRSLSLTEIAEISGMGVSASQRFLATFHELGYLERDPKRRTYRPAPKMLELAYTFLSSDRMIETTTPHLLELSDRIDETVNFLILDIPHVVFVARFPRRLLRLGRATIGTKLPALRTASGIAMLSKAGAKTFEECVALHEEAYSGDLSESDLAKARDAYEAAKNLGYVIDEQSIVQGEISVAAVIQSDSIGRLGAINVPLAETIPNRTERTLEIALIVEQYALTVSAALNAR